MINRCSSSTLKTFAVGALAGAAAFLALSAGSQTVLTVAQVDQNVRAYIGTTAQVTGLVQSVRSATRTVKGRSIPYVQLNLYKVDAKGRKTGRYIYVALPSSSFQSMPVEGQMMSVTGPLKWGNEIAAIDP
ncbi:MAG: hypothetical protein KGJ84_02605 [Elusimicrobia bacterium]|nr:hypothetical protein [Elusimicrobiota bacterium]